MSSPSLLDRLEKDGFVIIPSALTSSQLTTLRDASAHATSLARAGKWPHIRTTPKQFPPWPSTPGPDGIWGVQGMMHPDMPGREVFTSFYFSDAVISPTKELLQCTEDELVMELCNLLVRPDKDFELVWHRDDIPPSATDEEELWRLNQPAYSAQWNLALYDDSSLIVIPGSHKRARTARERRAGKYDPLEGEITVELKAGDVVFYNNNILHRGRYDKEKERMTLHGSVGHVNGANIRARNVLQHGGREWVERCDFRSLEEGVRERAEAMRERLVRLGKEAGEVGFSLEG